MASLSQTQTQALRALIAWWEAAGVEVAPPPAPRSAAPKPSTRPLPGAPARSGAQAASGPAQRAAPGRARVSGAVGARPLERPPAPEDLLEEARALAAGANSLAELETAVKSFTRHPLASAARNTVFARGDEAAPVMIIGEAPGRDEDRAGKPFVGRSGQLMDRMFAEIGLSDQDGLYITNVVNWRPRDNRTPGEVDIALCRPFIERHVALKKPKVLVFAGATAAQTLLGVTQGITRLRGKWMEYQIKDGSQAPKSAPAMAIFHPAYLLRRPIAKRETWRDLMAIEEALNSA
ncbi:MAG: uracil-DNA glycosylase family protein [Maricaulaceae bacterium]|jgi:DNA polymerase